MHTQGSAPAVPLSPAENPSTQDPTGLRSLIEANAEALVKTFYDTLLEAEEAQTFLSHSVVHQRLSRSLHNWLTELLDPDVIITDPTFIARQVKIGEVHARIKIPMHLVMSGASILKTGIADLLTDQIGGFAYYRFIDERFDVAMRYMSQSYVKGTLTRARLDEAYRLFSLDQDITLERERQRGSLLEWSQATLFRVLAGETVDGSDSMNASPFGLWLRHRAGFLFENSPHLISLAGVVDRIDLTLLPQLASGHDGDRAASLKLLQVAVEEAAYLLQEMFQVLGDMEGGRDPLTRALNRRFLPSILSREIGISNAEKTALSIMLIDVDHFKSINDQHGHQAGDEVLRHVAAAIIDNVRPSDFVFRYGGEEFLVVLVETDIEQAALVAERVRVALQQKSIKVGNSGELRVAASIGVVEHSGHPDESFLIKSADEALYRAKQGGRNRVVRA
ncbi:diguanylate cyclase [Brevundimonas vesicularis]|uniref:GGDEF domain-containing protein n=1 Tax=Brevundimonas vesicularis TaxID=41276 RepID=UPI0038D36D2C